jgi:hypothetical protein
MLVHVVFFWLRPDLSEAERVEFKEALDSLKGIQAVDAVYTGTPAGTERRPVIDSSYDFALTVLCTDLAAHDAYQVDPLHLAFVNGQKPKWTRVQIYDAE